MKGQKTISDWLYEAAAANLLAHTSDHDGVILQAVMRRDEALKAAKSRLEAYGAQMTESQLNDWRNRLLDYFPTAHRSRNQARP